MCARGAVFHNKFAVAFNGNLS
eukprot:COSAG01_NODE_14789_length_1409_cov_22.230769_1_plen_21_part_10